MKIVRTEPNERVDLSDFQAISFLLKGEFNRYVRTLLSGPTSAVFFASVIRGFVPSLVGNVVTVKFDLLGDGSSLSAALATHVHTTSAGQVFSDQGQVLGDRDYDGTPEGTAERTIDFTGRAAGSYSIFVRYTLATGDTDNRAFWNPVSNTDFVQSIETRFVPTWEMIDTLFPNNPPVPLDQWLVIASVTVDGTGNVIAMQDVRRFLLEGSTFDFATQATSTLDFDRSSARKDVGINHVIPMLRALMQQVMDLKGQDSSGNWNWYARPIPIGPTAFGLSNSTKSLRSLDIITFTVGDGITEWGDFNGVLGLESALRYIADTPATFGSSKRYRILLKSKDISFSFQITTAPVFANGESIEIVGVVGGFLATRGQIAILIDLATPVMGIQLAPFATQGTLHLENLSINVSATTPGVIGVGVFEPHRLSARNVSFNAASGTVALQTTTIGLNIENCNVAGRTQFYSGVDASGFAFSVNPYAIGIERGQISRTSFAGPLLGRIVEDTTGITESGASKFFANNLTFSKCNFLFTEGQHIEVGFINFRGCRGVTFDDCEILYCGNTPSCVATGVAVLSSGFRLGSHKVRFSHCKFMQFSAGSASFGLGYAIYALGGDLSALEVSSGIIIEDCVFATDGSANPSRFGVSLNDCRDSIIKDCQFEYTAPAGSSLTVAVELWGATTSARATRANAGNKVVGCSFKTTQRTTTNRFIGIDVFQGDDIQVVGNTFDGATLAVPTDASVSKAIRMSAVTGSIASGNKFRRWYLNGSHESRVCVDFNNCSGLTIANNIFDRCYGTVVYCRGLFRDNTFHGNKFLVIDGEFDPTTYLPQNDQIDYALVDLKDATFTSDSLMTPGANTSGRTIFIGNSWDMTDQNLIGTAIFRCLNVAQDRYASFSGNHFREGSAILKDISGQPAVMPDILRTFGWNHAESNLFAEWRQE
jgi:hypothetical protein